MKIALDYDKTYTEAPDLWDQMISLFLDAGHEVRIVTARHEVLDNIDDKVSPDVDVIYCDGVAKKWFCHHKADWNPTIWIDDKPQNIFENGPLTRAQLAEWRASDEYEL